MKFAVCALFVVLCVCNGCGGAVGASQQSGVTPAVQSTDVENTVNAAESLELDPNAADIKFMCRVMLKIRKEIPEVCDDEAMKTLVQLTDGLQDPVPPHLSIAVKKLYKILQDTLNDIELTVEQEAVMFETVTDCKKLIGLYKNMFSKVPAALHHVVQDEMEQMRVIVNKMLPLLKKPLRLSDFFELKVLIADLDAPSTAVQIKLKELLASQQ